MTTNIVTLLRARSGFTNVADVFAIYNGGYIDEYNETVEKYILPEGYTVRSNGYGEKMIFGPNAKYGSELVMHSSGLPQLAGCDCNMPVLKRA